MLSDKVKDRSSACAVLSVSVQSCISPNHKISSMPFAGPVFGDLLDFTGAGFCRLRFLSD